MSQVLKELLTADNLHILIWWRNSTMPKSMSLLLAVSAVYVIFGVLFLQIHWL